MSVRTDADEKLDNIRDSLKQLNRDLVAWIIDDDVWGRHDYTDEFEERMQEALKLIRSAKKLIG